MAPPAASSDPVREALAAVWPQFALALMDGDDLILRLPTDEQLLALAQGAASPGAVLPVEQHHLVTWLTPDPVHVARTLVARVWQHRAVQHGQPWTLDLAVYHDGQPVGMQRLHALPGWPEPARVATSSWLLATHQRRGLGRRARALVLHLAFDVLGAAEAWSWVAADNVASSRVSEALGYEAQDSKATTEGDGRIVIEVRHRLLRECFDAAAELHGPVKLIGVEGLLRLVEVGPQRPGPSH